jgi:hypothetical protein
MACCVLAAALVGAVARRLGFGRRQQTAPSTARWQARTRVHVAPTRDEEEAI